MDIARFWIDHRIVTLVLALAVLVGGIASFQRMSRLEDPEFTIKDALVVTPYPGASALEVEEEVTDVIEEAAQRLGQLERLESRSERGLSTLTVRIQDQYDKTTLPQVWDELRRKVVDVQANLPRVPALRSWSTTSETSTASSSRSSVTSTITRS